MRLIILMVVCLNLSLSANVYSQADKFSVQKRNATVKEVFDKIMEQSNYRFFYNNEFDVMRKISIDVKNADIDAVVNKILEGQSYSYKLMDNYVIIKRNDPLPQTQNPHVRRISGIVKDEEGNPLPGVSIALAGTGLGVATGIDGKFIFNVPGPGSILKISFIGKKTEDIVVLDQTYFEIVLKDDSKQLQEVVCTGIQTISRERATGAFELLTDKELDRSLTSDLVTRMQGKIAGVQIDKDNQMLIRGRGSILSDTKPLIVVDGFPIEAELSSVNPDDIETITVLKDAAAASIWGVRAANGVVVITTKSGNKQGKTTLDVSYFLTVNAKPQFKDLHLLNTEQTIDLELEQIVKEAWHPIYGMILPDIPFNSFQKIYYDIWKGKVDWMDEYDSYDSKYDQIVADTDFQKKIAELRKVNAYKQFEEHLLRKAVENRLNVAVRGGSERSDYYLSAVYDRQLLETVGDKSNSLVFNLKHNYALADRLTLSSSVNVNYQKDENNGISTFTMQNTQPFEGIVDEQGKRVQHDMLSPFLLEGLPEMGMESIDGKGYMSYLSNLLDDQELNNNTTNAFSARLNAGLKLNIIEGMDVETRFQYERGYSKTEDQTRFTHSSLRKIINDYALYDPEKQTLTYQIPMGDCLTTARNDFEAWTWRSQLTYNRGWNDSKHLLAAVFGHEMRMYKTSMENRTLYGYNAQSMTYSAVDEQQLLLNNYQPWYGQPTIPVLSGSPFNSFGETDNRDVSVFLNAAYTFHSKYTLSASGRIDQSNLFGNDSDYKYNFIWSTGLSWRISEEEFMKADWLDQLLFRATYGIGGNVNKDFFPVLMGKSETNPVVGDYIYLFNPANKNLTWEKSTTFNLGVDFAFLTNRINGSFDYYHKKGTDLLGRTALDPTNGFSSATMNFASVLNQGFEFTLNTVPLRIKDFTWNLGFNISYNKNKVTEVDVEGSSEENLLAPLTSEQTSSQENGIAIKGKPLGRLYAYNYAGVDKSGRPLLWENGKKIPFEEYSQTPEALEYVGTSVAPWFGGISTSLEWKGITLAANATYEFGHKFRIPVSAPGSGGFYNTIADRWRSEGDEDHTMVPALVNANDPDGFNIPRYYEMANIHVRDAAFLRLNEISLGYQLPKTLLGKTFVKALNVQFQVRNAALWTKNKEHIDPQAVIPGNSYFSSGSYSFPQPLSFILGIKATF